jgi:hypothetical protein
MGRSALVLASLAAVAWASSRCGGQAESAASVADDASPGAACGPTPTTILSAWWRQADAHQGQVGDIAVSGTDLYFALSIPGSIWRVSIAGGTPTQLASLDGEEAQMLVTGSSVVVAESFNGTKGNAIIALPTSGGSPITLATADGITVSLVTDGTDVYFSDRGGTKVVPLAGGAVQTLTTKTGYLGLAGLALLIADTEGGNVFSIPASGGTPSTIATNQVNPEFPVTNGSEVCWIDALPCAGLPDGSTCVAGQGEGAIVCIAPDAAPVAIAESPLFYLPRRMLFDGESFFVTTALDASLDGDLSRVPAAGGKPTLIAHADTMAIAGGCVYALDYFDGISTIASSGSPSQGDD